MTIMDNFLIAKATDVGVTRQLNEDSMTVFDSPNGQVMAVCDGMGGQAAGDMASQLSCSIIESILTDNTFSSPEEAIQRSVLAANQGVLNRAAQNPDLEGMGSTCVMLIIKDGRVHCGWVGDSRIYYISNHTIRQISHDQSYVQQLVDSGQITAEEAVNHPQKNEITNCIGLQGMTAPETIPVPIVPEPGSIFMLCSDGLSGMMSDQQIERVLSNSQMTLQQKADRLVAMANEAGGLDNITVELVQFGAAAAAPVGKADPKAATPAKKSNSKLFAIIGALVIVAGLAFGGYVYFTQDSKPKSETPKSPVRQGATENASGTATEKEKPKAENNSTNTGSSSTSTPSSTPSSSTSSRSNRNNSSNSGGSSSSRVDNVRNASDGGTTTTTSDGNKPPFTLEVITEDDLEEKPVEAIKNATEKR